MSRKILLLVVSLAAMLVACGCGDNRLLSIQVVPVNPSLTTNNIVYIAPGGNVQYQIIGWYSNRNSQTIIGAQGHWSSSNTAIATVDGNGLATLLASVLLARGMWDMEKARERANFLHVQFRE